MAKLFQLRRAFRHFISRSNRVSIDLDKTITPAISGDAAFLLGKRIYFFRHKADGSYSLKGYKEA